MSLLSSSCSFNEQEHQALMQISSKENIFPQTFISYKDTTILKIDNTNLTTTFRQNIQKDELSFRAKGLETQIIDLKNNELKLHEQLKLQKSIRAAMEKELIEIKQYLKRQQRISQHEDWKKIQIQLTQKSREVELTKQQLNTQRLKSRIDGEKERKRTEQLQNIRKQIQTYHLQFEQTKTVQKELQQKVSENERTIIQLKFEKNTLVQQLKYHKAEKESLFVSVNQEKCQELISVTRQLNQMSLECAKWRTQWQQLRSQQEETSKHKGQMSHLHLEQQKVIKNLRQEIEAKKQSESLFQQQVKKAKLQVSKIQESERVRKEEMAKKDRYVLKLETQTKKFEEQCQLKLKQMESIYETRISCLKEQQKEFIKIKDESCSQFQTENLRVKKLQEEKQQTSRILQQKTLEIQNLTSLNHSLVEEASKFKQMIEELKKTSSDQILAISALQSQNNILLSQLQCLKQAKTNIELSYQQSLQSVSQQNLESFRNQYNNLQSQFKNLQSQFNNLSIQHNSLLNQYNNLSVQFHSKEEEANFFRSDGSGLRKVIKQLQQENVFLKGQREQDHRRFKSQKEKLKKQLTQKEIILRVVQSQSKGMESIMNEEMDKRNKVIEQLVREVRQKKY